MWYVEKNHERRRESGKMASLWLPVLLTLMGVLPGHAREPQGHSSNSLNGFGYGRTKGSGDGLFIQSNNTEIKAQAGSTAALPCRLTTPLGDRMVSWVRRRNYQVLTVGRQVYSSDARIGVKVAEDGREWLLTIRYVDDNDAGAYQCQVSSHPPKALTLHLHVVEARAQIVGDTEKFLYMGSKLLLKCLLKGATEPPVYVFWYRGDRMINYDQETGVTVDNRPRSSKLFIASVSSRDAGNYTCAPSNAAPASVVVTVIQTENPVGLLQNSNTNSESGTPPSSSSSKTKQPAAPPKTDSSKAITGGARNTTSHLALNFVSVCILVFLSRWLLDSNVLR